MGDHWEHFEHDADIDVRGYGAIKPLAFEQAARALIAVVTDPQCVAAAETVPIECRAEDDEWLLAAWLNARASGEPLVGRTPSSRSARPSAACPHAARGPDRARSGADAQVASGHRPSASGNGPPVQGWPRRSRPTDGSRIQVGTIMGRLSVGSKHVK